jgi:hypothetical protein
MQLQSPPASWAALPVKIKPIDRLPGDEGGRFMPHADLRRRVRSDRVAVLDVDDERFSQSEINAFSRQIAVAVIIAQGGAPQKHLVGI